ncbi:hypothetical protein PybrP1_002185 [[Pythium] brassicae (nom. inval.)]|nr:hypothetical protein PybrP1_002185 [[Pythium] brassicae (nom. inval.)]
MGLGRTAGVQVDIAAASGAQLSFSAAGELTIRCANFTGDVVLSAAKPEPTPVAPSPSSSSANKDRSSSRSGTGKRVLPARSRGDSFNTNSMSDSDDSGVHVVAGNSHSRRSSSALERPSKRRRLESRKKPKLSTASRPPRPHTAPAAAAARPTGSGQGKRHMHAAQQAKAPPPPARVARAPDSLAYFQSVTDRKELSDAICEASEDFCFLCRDGGLLIECNWGAGAHDARRCPKVHHEECLGYAVPESPAVWKCPHHRCQLCGSPAKYSCRFCVSSYCAKHVPREIKTLRSASRDIPGSTYILCVTCGREAQRAVNAGKLSSESYALMLRLPVAPY